MRAIAFGIAIFSCAALAACGPGSRPAQPGPFLPARSATAPAFRVARNPIRHVVIVVQENRSFDNLFTGYPGALSHRFGLRHDGSKVRLHAIGFSTPILLTHGYAQARTGYNGGGMNGFDVSTIYPTGAPAGNVPYAYVQRSLVAPYWSIAKSYVLGDRMFPTMLGASFTAHLDLIAGTSNLNPFVALADTPSNEPWGCDAPAGTTTPTLDFRGLLTVPGPFPCFTQFRTIADTLDAAHVSWRYYVPGSGDPGGRVWNEFQAVANVRYGADWDRDVVTPQTSVLADAAAGTLASVSWVMPDWADSDHSWSGRGTGPSWVSAVVNAIGNGPDWNSTAIFVVWDHWGGFYDGAVPPQMDFRGLGIRVPFLVVSPYAKRGYVSHTQYEFGSMLKFVEQTFGLPPLGSRSDGYTDGRANSPEDCFDFAQPPRAFHTIQAPLNAEYFVRRPASRRNVDTE